MVVDRSAKPRLGAQFGAAFSEKITIRSERVIRAREKKEHGRQRKEHKK